MTLLRVLLSLAAVLLCAPVFSQERADSTGVMMRETKDSTGVMMRETKDSTGVAEGKRAETKAESALETGGEDGKAGYSGETGYSRGTGYSGEEGKAAGEEGEAREGGQRKRQAIDDIVKYQAGDSLVLTGNGTAFLHGKGNIKYKTMDLTSDYIRVKMDSSTLYASGVYDSTVGEWKGLPVFADGEEKYESKELTYNLKTQKGYIRHVVTEQGEGYVISEKTKKMSDDVMMMGDGKYTTCDDHEKPHFYLALTKAKVKPGKYIATGPAYLVVGDVPLPLAIPFGFFPFTDKYSSGLIMPSFGDDRTRGLYLKGGGYYFAINDYFDLEVTGDIFSRGSWAVYAQTKYKWRYHFSGSLSFSFNTAVNGEPDLPDYSKTTAMRLQWSHSQDQKSNPYSTFSASVNFSTSGYNKSNINTYYDAAKNAENTTSSSISYTQRFPDAPWTLTMSANMSQRMKDSTLTLSLPDVSVTMATVYPFKRKNPVGKTRWYEKIQLSYRGSIKNSITCKENYLFKSNFVKDWKNGVSHSVPISASFTAFKYLTITPNITYNEKWVFQRVDQSWDMEQNAVRRDTTNGFFRLWDVSGGLTMQTKLYGFYIPIRKLFGDKVDRFRHVFTPSINFNYRPDFTNLQKKMNTHYYDSYERPRVDAATGDTTYETINYNRFQGGAFSAPGQGSSGNLSFALGNNLEMKLRNDKDTTGKEPYKVYSLIDNLSISGGYNFLADSMNWSNFNVNLRIKLPKPLNYTINLSGAFDPYMYELNSSGNPIRTNKQYWKNGKFPHFLGTRTSFSYTFNNQTFKKWFGKKEKKSAASDTGEEPALDDGQKTELDNMQEESSKSRSKNKSRGDDSHDGFRKTDIQWSLSVNYSIAYGENRAKFNYEKMQYEMQWTHNLSFSGSLSLGEGWKVSTSTSYDFQAKKWAQATFNVSKSLHCWSMSASIIPFGPYKSYTFHIGVNASMLSDLKYDKSSADSTNKRVDWW